MNDKPKILMMTYNFPPWAGGDSIRIRKQVKYLLQMGWEVHVLTIGEKYMDPDAPKDNAILSEVKGAVIHRTRSFEPTAQKKLALRKASGLARDGSVLKNPGVIGRALAFVRRHVEPLVLVPDFTVLWAPFAILAGRKIAKHHGIKILFANCPPFGTLVGALCLSRIANLRLVTDIKDIWVGSPYHQNQSALRQKMDRFIERRVIWRSARTILVTAEAQALYRSRYPSMAQKLSLIPNGVDLVDFAGAATPPEGAFRLLIPGLLNVHRDPMPIVRVFADLQKTGGLSDDARLVFIGDVHPDHVSRADEILGDAFEYIPPVPHREFIAQLQKACALVVISSEGISTMVPGKLYEMIAAKRALLVMPGQGAPAALLEKYGYGQWANSDDEKGITAFIKKAHKDFVEGNSVTAPPEKLLLDFSREHQAGLLNALFTDNL